MSSGEPLVCPSCAITYGLDERFCARCGMPLVYAGAELAESAPVTERHIRARKVKPQLSEGELVRVAGARNQAEGEFIQGLLLEEGVPSVLRRTAGFDVPDFLAAGPRDVMVPESGVPTAREVLLSADLLPTQPPYRPQAGKLLAALVAAVVLVGMIAWIGSELLT